MSSIVISTGTIFPSLMYELMRSAVSDAELLFVQSRVQPGWSGGQTDECIATTSPPSTPVSFSLSTHLPLPPTISPSPSLSPSLPLSLALHESGTHRSARRRSPAERCLNPKFYQPKQQQIKMNPWQHSTIHFLFSCTHTHTHTDMHTLTSTMRSH